MAGSEAHANIPPSSARTIWLFYDSRFFPRKFSQVYGKILPVSVNCLRSDHVTFDASE